MTAEDVLVLSRHCAQQALDTTMNYFGCTGESKSWASIEADLHGTASCCHSVIVDLKEVRTDILFFLLCQSHAYREMQSRLD